MRAALSVTSRRTLTAVVAGFALVGTACNATTRTVTTDIAVDPGVMVDPPAPDFAPDQGAPDQPDDQGATVVERNPDVTNGSPVAWEKVSFDRESQTLSVYWWSGVEPCTALEDVVVTFDDDQVEVTVLEGSPPEAATMSCIAMAQYKTISVELAEDPGDRRFVDGSQ